MKILILTTLKKMRLEFFNSIQVSDNLFEKIFFETLFYNMPKIFLEGFLRLKNTIAENTLTP